MNVIGGEKINEVRGFECHIFLSLKWIFYVTFKAIEIILY